MVNLSSLYMSRKVGVYKRSDIYDPDDNPGGSTIAEIGSLLTEPGLSHQVYEIVALNVETYKPTLVITDRVISSNDDDTISMVDYGNNKFPLFVDNRTAITRLQPAVTFKITNLGSSTYTLYRYPDTSNVAIISEYYNTNGVKTGTSIPMVPTQDNSNSWAMSNCHTTAELEPGERIKAVFFNDEGSEIGHVYLFVKFASVQNTIFDVAPTIVDIRVVGNNEYGENTFFLRENQTADSLMLSVEIVYADGTYQPVDIDYTKCFLYGLENFTASYAGQRHTFMVKYFLDVDERIDSSSAQAGRTSYSKEYAIIVRANTLLSPGKVSIIPQWNSTVNAYVPRYWYYNTDRTDGLDVTLHTTITSGTFETNNYTQYQEFVISTDLHATDPALYPDEAVHTQTICVKLNNPASTEKYYIKDSLSSTIIYGMDNATQRRPRIYCDTVSGKHFIPASIFTTYSMLVRDSYEKCSPPFNIDVETAYVAPTHFTLRNPMTGVMLVSEIIPLENYAMGFNITGANQSILIGTTVIIEFLRKMDDLTVLTLYGCGVEVQRMDNSYSG